MSWKILEIAGETRIKAGMSWKNAANTWIKLKMSCE
jgi:hypothetical protein